MRNLTTKHRGGVSLSRILTRWTAAGVAMAAALTLAVGSIGVTYAAGDADAEADPTPVTPVEPVLTPVPDVDGVNCSQVTDWNGLSKCMGQAASDGLVTITGTVTIPENAATITVSRNITLTASTGDDASLTGASGGNRLFAVGSGASLIIGKDKNDNGFSYRSGKHGFSSVNGGTLTINGGVFDGIDVTGNAGDDKKQGSIAYSNDGAIVINGGTFTNNYALRGGVVYGDGATHLEVKDGTFSANRSGMAAGVFMQSGEESTTIVYAGTFTNNNAGTKGGVLHSNGTLVIENGMFSENNAAGGANNGGGGAISQDKGSTVIKNGTFKNNTATGNGGAIYSKKKLTVQGPAEFSNNQAKANEWTAGGGAIWADGELHVKKNAKKQAPTFTNNTALTELSGNNDKLGKGGAGGAIFFNLGVFYLTGGTFTGNQSGYLGGAVYTEEGSTTYVAKAVAYGNTAGHFGGGLWFCPSGNSAASKGGNIALFDNHVGSPTGDGISIDGNTDNDVSKIPKNSGANTLTAGSDLAIMNPYWKWENAWISTSSNQFQLLDTWFTDRSADATAVTWTWDNVPLRESSGYHDSWLPMAPSNSKKDANGKQLSVRQDIDAVLATTTYQEDGSEKNGSVQEAGVLQLQADPNVKDTDTVTWIRTGVALKATVVGDKVTTADQKKEQAKDKAQVTMTSNQARLSGGAFGSDGVVLFDTPHSMNWEKIDMGDGEDAKLDATDKPVTATSTWTLTYTGSGTTPYNDEDMRPEDCPVLSNVLSKNTNTKTVDNTCWHWVSTDNGKNGHWTVDILDNGSRDNDPAVGSFSLENLAIGTYELTEKEAPAGFQKTGNVYTFKIEQPASGKLTTIVPELTLKTGSADDNKGPVDSKTNRIGNKRVTGKLDWTKIGADGSGRIDGSEWEITHTKVDGQIVKYTIKDCIVDGEAQCPPLSTDSPAVPLDTDKQGGGFDIPIAGKIDGTTVDYAANWPDGEYTITETKAPEGYVLPAKDKRSATFTISTDHTTGNRTVKWGDSSESGHEFVNQPTEVSWTKVETGGTTPIGDSTIGGAEWTLTKTGTIDQNNKVTEIEVDKQTSWAVQDCGADSAGCADTVTDTAGSKNHWKDSDASAGKFTLQLLLPGTYTLKETKAPGGYVLDSGKTYEFTISTNALNDGELVQVCPVQSGASTSTKCDNVTTPTAIPNAKAIAVLPLTGGLGTGWGRLLLGGGFAVAAALAAAVTYEWRRRKAFDV